MSENRLDIDSVKTLRSVIANRCEETEKESKFQYLMGSADTPTRRYYRGKVSAYQEVLNLIDIILKDKGDEE